VEVAVQIVGTGVPHFLMEKGGRNGREREENAEVGSDNDPNQEYGAAHIEPRGLKKQGDLLKPSNRARGS